MTGHQPRYSSRAFKFSKSLEGRPRKAAKLCAQSTVLKLTQVRETSSLRRSGERWLRNSAKWPRKFAIRGASDGLRCWRPQKIGSNDCLSKTQVSANT